MASELLRPRRCRPGALPWDRIQKDLQSLAHLDGRHVPLELYTRLRSDVEMATRRGSTVAEERGRNWAQKGFLSHAPRVFGHSRVRFGLAPGPSAVGELSELRSSLLMVDLLLLVGSNPGQWPLKLDLRPKVWGVDL